jgi:hypothetical protein
MSDKLSPDIAVRKGATQAAFNADSANVLIFETLVIAVAVGCWQHSWWWFGGTFLSLMIMVQIKTLANLMATLLSAGWAAIGYGVGMLFSHDASIVLAILGLLSSLGVHLSAIRWARDVGSD